MKDDGDANKTNKGRKEAHQIKFQPLRSYIGNKTLSFSLQSSGSSSNSSCSHH